MSKSVGAAGDLAISSFIPSPRQKTSSNTKGGQPGKSSGTSNFGQVNIVNPQKIPRSTHRHHRKPESNLNHLLNFSYTRPANNTSSTTPRRNVRSTNPTYGRGSGYHPMDKAHFVNANYRFIVHPSGDYRSNLLQSDVPVPWENVLQVLASVQSQCNACPICLEATPIAPRMAKCGHIFCLPCILRYLDSEDVKTGKASGKWRKCPICFDGIYAKELRPVRWCDGDDELPAKGHDVTLQLIMRQAGSMFALPRDSEPVADDAVPWHNQAEIIEYARLVRGDDAYMSAEATREIGDLLRMKEEDERSFGDEGQWTATAIQSIEDASTVYESLGNAPRPKPSQIKPRDAMREPIKYTQAEDAPDIFLQQDVGFGSTAVGSETRARHVAIGDETDSHDAYYFYQPRTGSHFYLAPLDIRILKKAFESFASFPSALVAKVEHMSTVTVDEDLRRRTKYLSHLPLGCEVTFLECDWSGVLDRDVLKTFKVDTDKRRKKRHDKAVSEESARRRAQALEERRERAGLGEISYADEDTSTSYFARNDESNTYEVFADDMAHSLPSVNSNSLPTGSLERRSIWGTALPTTRDELNPAAVEDDDWKEQLEKFYEDSAISASTQEADATPGKKVKTKKKKLVLMTSGGGRGRG